MQEALSNVLKHAAASNASVAAQLADGQVRIAVKRRRPRVSTRIPITGGRGLTGMRERIQLLGGEIEVVSGPGSGTRIIARVPIQAG